MIDGMFFCAGMFFSPFYSSSVFCSLLTSAPSFDGRWAIGLIPHMSPLSRQLPQCATQPIEPSWSPRDNDWEGTWTLPVKPI